MILRTLYLFMLIAISLSAASRQKHTSYKQALKGTTLGFEMMAIPGGQFQMGNPRGSKDEQPAHTVQLDPFWMSKFEVTWDLFEPFLYKDFEKTTHGGAIPAGLDAVTRPTKPYLDMTFGMGKENYPALAMTQYNAIQFCKWLYTQTGIFYRLPTEAEWEYACKAGGNDDFYFGNDTNLLGEYAWFKGNSDKKTHPVGQKKPNAWGLYDMLGNVAEWTYDQYLPEIYQERAGKKVTNPVVVASQLYPLVLRGGSYEEEASALRSSARSTSEPAWKQIDPQIPKSNWWFPEAPFIGIRLVRPLKNPDKAEILAYYDKKPIPDY